MASVFGHAVGALGIGQLFPKQMLTRQVIGLGMLFSMLPDVDVLAFGLGIPYDNMLGHRGLTHSLAFAAAWALIWVFLLHRKAGLVYILLPLYGFAWLAGRHDDWR